MKIYSCIDSPTWRVWKIVDEDGIVRQNAWQLSSPNKLLSFVRTSKRPMALYVSSSTFLNPHKFKGFLYNQKKVIDGEYFYNRPGYMYADNILLDSYFFIDLDSPGNLRVAQEDARKIIYEMMGVMELHSIQFSGNKGLHLIYKHHKINEPHPIKRILMYKYIKKQLTERLLKLNLKCIDKHHASIMQDLSRVYACPYSIKSNGNIVTPLNYEDVLNEDIYHILRTGVSEPKGDDVKASSGCSTIKSRQECADSNSTSFSFIDNNVRKLKNTYVTVIKINKKKFNPNYINLIKKVQARHKLDDFVVYEIGDYIYLYNTKLVQFKKLIKILKMSKSENLFYFYKYHHLPIHASDEICGTETIGRYKVGIIKSDIAKEHFHSKPHSILLDLQYDNVAGKANNIGTMSVS